MKTHRVVHPSGTIEWRLPNGRVHREDGPARIEVDGTKTWFHNGNHHRLDGPASEHANGTRAWWVDGERHREDGPAIERVDGHREWYVRNRRHRLDGPAVIHSNGSCTWHVNNVPVPPTAGYDTLDELLHADDLDTLAHVLLAWRPDGPTLTELAAAVHAAHA